MPNILILEDDYNLAGGIHRALSEPGRSFTVCHNIATARQAVKKGQYDLFIFDVGLPDGSGLDFCAEIRGFLQTPILFLSAKDTEMDVVSGLEMGGDDYITKPFSLAVLRARVAALLRRNAAAPTQALVFGGLHLDFERLLFTKNGVPLEFSKTEQRVLHLLASNPGQTIQRERLLEYVWPDGSDYVDENALSVAISRLRAKLEDDPAKPRHIKTVRGIGYSWAVIL